MRAAAFPLVLLAAGVVSVAAAWTRPAWDGLARQASVALGGALVTGVALALGLGWRAGIAALLGGTTALAAARLGTVAAPGLATGGLGIAAASLMSFGFDETSWRAAGAVAGALAVGGAAAALALRVVRHPDEAAERTAVSLAALVAPIVVAVLAAVVVNRPDAVALAAAYAAAAIAGGALVTGFTRLVFLRPTAQGVAHAAVATVAAWWATAWFDPVLLASDGDLLGPRAAFPAVAAGIVAGIALPDLRAIAGARMAGFVTLVVCVATVAAAAAVAGPYGAGVAVMAFTCGALTERPTAPHQHAPA